ncbi:MAG: hypothetical protein QOJ60_194, partial [Actinomycetota bacterium]|nr:hypothetical protein [Actinomycetota bacterium]
ARERVRVARTLLLLPKVAAALAEGQLSYCKVRALSRVATPVTEDELLEVARSCTGAQLERVVRSWRQALTAEDSASATLRRKLTRRVEPDGSVTFTIRVPPDEVPVVDAALDRAARVVLDDEGRPIEVAEETESGCDPRQPWQPMPPPLWGGERLRLAWLIDPLLANVMLADSQRSDGATSAGTPRTLREATGWPIERASRSRETGAHAA